MIVKAPTPKPRYVYVLLHGEHIHKVLTNRTSALTELEKARERAIGKIPLSDTLGEYFQLVRDCESMWKIERHLLNATGEIE